MKVGVFSPVLNYCGGAEWVAINIMAALKEHGHQVVLLTDKTLNQDKFKNVFNRQVSVDQQIVFPLAIFPALDYRNFYTDCMRSLFLKLNCDLLIDTYSNAILPGMNISYIHYPLFSLLGKRLALLRSRVFYSPYWKYLDLNKKNLDKKLILANSEFTSKAVEDVFRVNSHVLYPPVSNDIFKDPILDLGKERTDTVLTIGRISHEKNLQLIPYIAQKTHKRIAFIIAGLLASKEVLESLLELIKKLGVADRVKILPNVRRDHLKQLLWTSKVYLHPKINEHFGISIVEAMASGCIPVVHNSGGAKEFVPRNLRYNNIEEAAETIETTIGNWSPEEARNLMEQAEQFSEENFSKKFITLFNSYSNIYH